MPRPGDEPFEMGDECKVLRTTDKAMLVSTDHGEVWIPFDQVHDDSELFQGSDSAGKLIIKQWLAEERGWC